jgi:hypothetical protein
MTWSRRWVRGAVLVALLIAGSVLARAQEISASISGTVVDATGASVGGAVVTLTNTDRAYVERTVKTNKAGFYTATSLPLGNYSVAIAMKGFKTAFVTGIVLNASDALKLDQKLAVGSTSETVTVVASQAELNLENGMSEGLVTGTQVRELVLNNRNYEQLLTLQPGVAYGGSSDQLYIGASLPAGTANTVAFSINGSRATANNWTIDGADNVDRGSNLTLLSYPSVDAISEFVTLRGTYEAEYGRSASGQVNVVTRSGTNAIHGGAYEFFRNDIFNANNYFNNLAAVARPELRYNDFGFTLGGPVMIPHLYNGKDKTFFFYSQEFRRVVNYASTTSYVPTAAEQAGNFGNSAVCQQFAVASGACTAYTTGQIGSGYLSPTALAYVSDIYAKVPAPNPAAGQDPHTLTSNIRNVFNDAQEFARVDHAMGKRVNLFYRYLHDSLPSTEGSGLFVGATTPGMPGVQTSSTRAPGTQHMGHATIVARPTILIDLGYAFSSGAILSRPVGSAASANSPSIDPTLPYISTLGMVPAISFAGGNVTGVSSAGIYNDYSRNHNGFGDITKIVRQHTLKFGITYNHYQKMENVTGNSSPYPEGQFSFSQAATPTASQLSLLPVGTVAASPFDSEFANFMIGNANNGFTQGSAALTANINENLIELYAQDDWRASRRLTLNLGVRYSYFGQPYDINAQLSNFDPAMYLPLHAETISSNGLLCTVAGQTTSITTFTTTGVSITSYLANCPNVNGLNPYQPNTIADPLNGIILASGGAVAGDNLPFTDASTAPSIDTHGSPFGLNVGHAEKHDFAPRVGFAYDVFGNGKTALRGGYGMAYDESAVSIYEQEVFNNPPFLNVNTYTAASLDDPRGNTILPNAAAVLTPPSLEGSPVFYQTPYVQQFSLDVQQAITSTLMLDLGYFGDHGTHLQGRIDINEAQPRAYAQTSIGYSQVSGCSGFTSQACEAPLNQVRPYLGYTAINSVETIFNSNYNSLQVKVVKKFSGKSMIDANYTWSRGLTDAQSDYSSAPQNSYNISQNYGPSAYNRNDILTIDGIWEVPWKRDQQGIVGHIVGGWEMSGIYAVNSGLPLTVTMSGGGTVQYAGLNSAYNPALTNGGVANDAAGLGILGPSAAGLRPSVVLNPNSGYGQVSLRKRLHWFNQSAFIAPSPASLQVGNEKTGGIDGPGFNRLDLGIFRNFKLYRGTEFQLRGEGFNVLNHTNWATVGTNATTSSTFGQVTATRDPRILQVGGKLSF